jgi:hypothetical protein
MSIFKRASDGSVQFSTGTKHAGKTLEEVARLDPQYLRWARRDMAIWAPDDIAQAIDKAMITNGVSFTKPKK